jgi:hypothetical protein
LRIAHCVSYVFHDGWIRRISRSCSSSRCWILDLLGQSCVDKSELLQYWNAVSRLAFFERYFARLG